MFQVLAINNQANRVPYGKPVPSEKEAIEIAAQALKQPGYIKAEVWSQVLTVSPKIEVEIVRVFREDGPQ